MWTAAWGRQLLIGLALSSAALLSPAPGLAQAIVASEAPSSVEVTIYRDPRRGASTRMNASWLNGFALISERREIAIPAGESEIRFEGVAGGILPQSAIVTGLPEGIVERNRDAYLLSPGTLLDRSLGRRVHLKRTDPATGAVTEQEALIRSGAAGAVVIETEAGVETLRCTGLPETIVYDQVPPGLSARPTLSVRARSREPVRATVTVSYLASGFDWQADYIANIAPDGEHMDLFAWLTLASTDETSFADANAQAVAGRVNWQGLRAAPSESRPINLQCWPHSTTSDVPDEDDGYDRNYGPPPPPPPPPPPSPPPPPPSAIMVTASQVAQQEELGDLKLYRIPERVTVASNGQKQVALLVRPNVAIDLVYRAAMLARDPGQAAPVQRFAITRNREQEGLGLPLPAGRLVAFAPGADRPILIGRGAVPDRAVGDDVEIFLGPATGVRIEATTRKVGEDAVEIDLVATNDQSRPVRLELELAGDGRALHSATRLGRRGSNDLWTVTIPANGSARLRYRP